MKKKKHGIIFKIICAILIVLLAIVLLLAGMIGFLSVTEYKPAETETLTVDGEGTKELKENTEISLLTFNIGYGALGDNADFFMDGGTSVMTADKDRVNKNLAGILNEVKGIDPDIVLFQEIDKNSTRSHYIDEYGKFKSELTDYNFSFANNFKVAFLPYPIPPIGKVDSGIATASKFEVKKAKRVQLPIPFSWPVRMANLKRCVLVSRFPIKNSEQELVIFNLHLEAYDDGQGKIAQTKMLADLLNAEAEKNNFVIAGGDFNQIFSTANKRVYPTYEGMWTPGEIDTSAFGVEGWQFVMDESVPSCRSLDIPYKGADKGTFQYYLIDGFIVSNTIEITDFKTQDLGFECSDHNPVLMKFILEE